MADGFDRQALPEAQSYFEQRSYVLTGKGRWRTTRCDFHGGSDSMRVNVRSGGWCCMACGAKGGDVLAFHMQINGMEFVDAARDLGAWAGDAAPAPWRAAAGLSSRDALELAAFEMKVALVVMSDARRGVLVAEPDWQRFLSAVGRVERLAEGSRS